MQTTSTQHFQQASVKTLIWCKKHNRYCWLTAQEIKKQEPNIFLQPRSIQHHPKK